jgi:transporter family protein
MFGEFLALATAICWGLSGFYDKKAIEAGLEPVIASIIRIGTAFLILLAFIFATGYARKIFSINAEAGLYAGLGGLFGGALGVILFYLTLQKIELAKAAPIASIFPLITVLLAIYFLHEDVSYTKVLIGALSITVGIALVWTA